MSDIQTRQQELIERFRAFKDWESRYREIIALGKALPPLPEEFKIEDLKVKGCQSQVWIRAERGPQGEVLFQADSDALIVRGLVAILLSIYSGVRPEEILNTPPDFIKELGLANHLSPSRANGLFAMIKQIQYYAMAFQALQKT